MDHSYVVHIENALHNLKINVFVQDRHLIPTPVAGRLSVPGCTNTHG